MTPVVASCSGRLWPKPFAAGTKGGMYLADTQFVACNPLRKKRRGLCVSDWFTIGCQPP